MTLFIFHATGKFQNIIQLKTLTPAFKAVQSYMQKKSTSPGLFLLCLAFLACTKNSGAEPGDKKVEPLPAPIGISIPLAGNAFLTQLPTNAPELITVKGLVNWENPGSICSGYFRLEQTGELHIALRLKVPEGTSILSIRVNGTLFSVNANNRNYQDIAVGKVTITAPGYVKVDLQGDTKTGRSFADVSHFIISGPATSPGVKYANDSSNFYWSRRGPSVHLGYMVPPGINAEWFYNEVTVPVGEDKVGSYFMSNGFGEGYFGMQVNLALERRILFSVWDPAVGQGTTQTVRNGANVTVQRFGGEGTGGQSYLVFDWKAGTPYQFLTQAKPDGLGNTLYSSWFYAPEKGDWQYMATWKRPHTTTYLTRPHSFLENFIDTDGWMGRKANYNNQWIRSSDGKWVELTTARFTGDATATNEQRMDFAGGLDTNGQFYLKNGGFFSNYININQSFTRKPTGKQPDINLSDLP